jgi:hypothetical protein
MVFTKPYLAPLKYTHTHTHTHTHTPLSSVAMTEQTNFNYLMSKLWYPIK